MTMGLGSGRFCYSVAEVSRSMDNTYKLNKPILKTLTHYIYG